MGPAADGLRQPPHSARHRQMRRIRKAGLVGAILGALIGAFFGLIAPITVAGGGFALIYLPPPSWVWLPNGIWPFGVFGALEWMIPGYGLGIFVGSVRRVPRLEASPSPGKPELR